MAEPRVVSLIPSGTEIVCALGGDHLLVGRSHECDFPPSVRRLPVCSEPRFDVNGDSRAIDERVRQTLSESAAVYRVFEELLAELQPSVIVTQAQCDVCAVSLADVETAVGSWPEAPPAIVSLAPASLTDIWRDIRAVGEALDRPAAAETLVQNLQQRLQRLRHVVRGRKPRVFCLEWTDPPMAAGNWVPELIEWLGAVDVLGTTGVHSEFTDWEAIRAVDPDVVVVMPCGFGLERTAREVAALSERPEWRSLTAVGRGEVYLTDGNQYFNRPGPRIVESAEILAEILTMGRVAFGHEGRGWQRWNP
jgi:iron complex transport system substrate-binding protein